MCGVVNVDDDDDDNMKVANGVSLPRWYHGAKWERKKERDVNQLSV